MAEGNGSNGGALVQLAKIEGARERVPLSHILTVIGLLGGALLYFESRLSSQDAALQREQRDLDHTLEIQIRHADEKIETLAARVISFIEYSRDWQMRHTEFSASKAGEFQARLDALEKRQP